MGRERTRYFQLDVPVGRQPGKVRSGTRMKIDRALFESGDRGDIIRIQTRTMKWFSQHAKPFLPDPHDTIVFPLNPNPNDATRPTNTSNRLNLLQQRKTSRQTTQ